MNTLIQKVIQFKDLYNKQITEGLDSSELEIYKNLYHYLQHEKYRDITKYKLDGMEGIVIKSFIEEEPTSTNEVLTEDELKDIYEEMELQIKIIHQKFINEGELEVEDVLLYDSIYPELKKNGFFVEKYRIR